MIANAPATRTVHGLSSLGRQRRYDHWVSRRVAVFALVTWFVAGVRPLPAAEAFVVIVHPSVAGTQVRRGDLAGLFLRKVTRWGDRSPAQPVDQSGASPVRKAFSEAVLGLPVAAVLQYWQKAMFATTPLHPPLVKPSDAEVVDFVSRTTGAVGYVSARVVLPPRVKVLAVID
jgi:ABC-type phosphate transport system substrate-binding protein